MFSVYKDGKMYLTTVTDFNCSALDKKEKKKITQYRLSFKKHPKRFLVVFGIRGDAA